ncbi:MAG TPA: hypothetical protein PLE30_10905 [Candidatus Kapabacteria bacterium]|nr:hypothetical protein [Candidatus Kapabacteria bacterium]
MYDRKDKKRIYWIIDQYLKGKITESSFCDEFYYSYDLELNRELLNEVEKQAFLELSKVSSRFSQYEEDHNLDKHAFSTVDELKQKIIETNEKLKQ